MNTYPTGGADFLEQFARFAPLVNPAISLGWLTALPADQWLTLAYRVQELLL